MTTAFELARIISIVAFLYFGTACLLSEAMILEFERYGLARFRILTGSLEVAGGLSLLLGYAEPALVVPASVGLALLMAIGIGVRVRIRDPIPEMLPAAILLLVNLFICMHALETFA